jgi:hypothetical protein
MHFHLIDLGYLITSCYLSLLLYLSLQFIMDLWHDAYVIINYNIIIIIIFNY